VEHSSAAAKGNVTPVLWAAVSGNAGR